MEIQERFNAIADEWVGKEEENRNRAVVVLAIEKDSEGKNGTIAGVIQGRASNIVDAFTQIIEDTDKDNQLGRVLRKAQHRVAMHSFCRLVDRVLSCDEKEDEEQREDTGEQPETTAEEQGKEASHE